MRQIHIRIHYTDYLGREGAKYVLCASVFYFARQASTVWFVCVCVYMCVGSCHRADCGVRIMFVGCGHLIPHVLGARARCLITSLCFAKNNSCGFFFFRSGFGFELNANNTSWNWRKYSNNRHTHTHACGGRLVFSLAQTHTLIHSLMRWWQRIVYCHHGIYELCHSGISYTRCAIHHVWARVVYCVVVLVI